MKPKVSVIIPAFNRAHLILETLDSVFAQTFKEYEVIVIDDGSTDNTQNVLQNLIKAGKIAYFYQKNAGQAAARNRGIREADGEHIAFLDSDDLFEPEKLARQVAVLDQNPSVGLVHSDYAKFDHETNRHQGYRDTSMFNGNMYPEILRIWSVFMALPCVLVRRSVLDQVGYFDEVLPSQEDPELWVRIARRFTFSHIPESLVRIRMHEISLSNDKTNAAKTFHVYLDKVFAEDAALTTSFQRKVLSKMYANVALNLLGTGEKEQMQMARRNSVTALGHWPFEWGAYAALLVSFIPLSLRNRLFGVWRKLRYR